MGMNIIFSQIQRRIVTIICCTVLGLILAFQLPVRSQGGQTNALQLALQGQQLYNAGQLDQAVESWQQAAEAYQAQGDRQGFFRSSISQAQALQDLGLYPKACNTLLRAFEVEQPNCSPEQLKQLVASLSSNLDSLNHDYAIGLRSLGNVLHRRGILEQAEKIVRLSLAITKNDPESSSTLLSLGNITRAKGDRVRDRWDYDRVTEIIDSQSVLMALKPYLAAFKAYNRSASMAETPLTQVQAQLNHYNLLLDLQDWWQQQTQRRIASWSRQNESKLIQRANNFLSQLKSPVNLPISSLQTQIAAQIDDLPVSRAGIYAQINFARSLARKAPTPAVESLLTNALKAARSITDRRSETYALGYLGQYYGQQGQVKKAIALTRQALVLAQAQNINGDAREISYLWQSQLGKFHRQQGNEAEAIVAYTAAFNTLQSLRNDLNINNANIQFDFRQEVRPVYLELAELLLRSNLNSNQLKSITANQPNFSQEQETKTPSNLELARRVIESLQLAELDNFFQDPCSQVTDVAVTIDDIDPQAAVIYPVVLPDCIKVILSLPGKPLQSFATLVEEKQVNQTLDLLYDTLYNRSVNNSAVNIFSTIPLNSAEVADNLQQLLPILEQLYSWLIEPLTADLASNQIETLVFVLNGKLQQVPMASLYDGSQYLLEKYSIALAPSLQLTNSQPLARQKLAVLAAGVSQQVTVQDKIFPALSNVPQELNKIESIFPTTKTLLNKDFTIDNLQKQLESNFPVIHLATHGIFSSDPERTFIITGDGLSPGSEDNTINLNQLNQAISQENIDQPELLVLSACETATGDERAILGLAGVAVRSGTRSTLATLWSVEDASTAQVMGQFYQEFKQPNVKKATALQTAQLSLLKSLRDNPPLDSLPKLPPHPYYLSPYVLVGNWQ